MYLLGSPVEIHRAGGGRASMKLGGRGRSGDTLMVHPPRRGRLLRARAATAAAAAAAAACGSLFLDWTAEVIL